MAINALISSASAPLPPLSANTPTTASQAASLAGAQSNNADINKVSTDFEAVFLTQMMEAMFSGDEFNSYFGSGTAGEVYKSSLLNEYGKLMAQAGGIGIATQVKQELLSLQEVHSNENRQ